MPLRQGLQPNAKFKSNEIQSKSGLQCCVRLVEAEESFPAALWGNLALWQGAGAEHQRENSHRLQLGQGLSWGQQG